MLHLEGGGDAKGSGCKVTKPQWFSVVRQLHKHKGSLTHVSCFFSPFCHMCSITHCQPFPPFRASAITKDGSQETCCADSPVSDTNQVITGGNQVLLLFLLCTLPFWTQAIMILLLVKGTCMNLCHQPTLDKSFLRLANKIQSTSLHSLQMSFGERRNFIAFCGIMC